MAPASFPRQRRDSWPLSREEKKDVANVVLEREIQAQEAILLDDPKQVHGLAETVLGSRRSGADLLSPRHTGKENELMAKLQKRRDVVDTQGIQFIKEGFSQRASEKIVQPSPEKTPETRSPAAPCTPGVVSSSLPASSPGTQSQEELETTAITVDELGAVASAAALAGDIEDIDEADLSALDSESQLAVKAAMEVLARVRAAKVAQSISKQEQRLVQQDVGVVPSWALREESPEVEEGRARSAPCAKWSPESERKARGALTPRHRVSRGEASKPPKKRVSFGKREEVIIDSNGTEMGPRKPQARRMSRGPLERPSNLDDDSDDDPDPPKDVPKENAFSRWWRKATVSKASSPKDADGSKDDDSGWLLSAY